MIFLCFSYDFLWISYAFPMIFASRHVKQDADHWPRQRQVSSTSSTWAYLPTSDTLRMSIFQLIGNAAYGSGVYPLHFRRTSPMKQVCSKFHVWKCLPVAILDNACMILCGNQKLNMLWQPTLAKTQSVLLNPPTSPERRACSNDVVSIFHSTK